MLASYIIFLFSALAVSVTLGLIKGKNQHETLGVLLLDAITFPKVVPHATNAVVVLVSVDPI